MRILKNLIAVVSLAGSCAALAAVTLPAPQNTQQHVTHSDRRLPTPEEITDGYFYRHLPPVHHPMYQDAYRMPSPIFKTPVIPMRHAPSPYAVVNQSDTHPEDFSKSLPSPTDAKVPAKTITLREAILLALRNNPDVINSELTRITDKYNIILVRRQFAPQYQPITASMLFQKGSAPTYSIGTGINLDTPIGTKFQFSYSTPVVGTLGSATLDVTQPLLRGFGYVNRIQLEDDYDNELVARLNFKSSIISVVQNVITSYRTLVEDYNNLAIQKQNLKETKETVDQLKMEVKYGKQPGNSLQQQEGNLATAKLSYIQTQDQVQDDYQSFLQDIGLIASARLKIITKINFTQTKIPKVKDAVATALAHNIQYRQDIIELRATKRAIITAQDARKPQFDVKAGLSVPDLGNPSAPGNFIPSFGFDFSVPIDDVEAKSALVGAKIAYLQAKNSLAQTKETVIQTVITDIQNLQNLKQQIIIGEQAVKLSELTLKDAQIQQRYGKITMFEVIQDQNNLLSQRTELVSGQISFLNSITNLNSFLGVTLNVWNVKLRY